MNKLNMTKLLLALLGKKIAYRLGRSLYLQARGDIENNMATNGELMLQHCVLDAWRKSLIPDSKLVIFDVGANIGDWSQVFLDNLFKSHDLQSVDLYLFEPVPNTAATLKERFTKLDNFLHFESLALSSQNGVDQFYVNCNENNAGTNSLYQQHPEMSPIEVAKLTASSFCSMNQINRIHLFKCDTEGHDMEVIRGALSLLAEEKISVFQFEYNYRWVYARNFLHDVFVITKNLPYKIVKLQSNHLLILNNWHFELEKFFEGNYALVHADSLSWFPTKNASFDCFNTMCVDV